MSQALSRRRSSLFVGSIVAVVVGVAVNTGLDSSYRLAIVLALIAAGVAGITSSARGYTADRLRTETRRWWIVALVTFIPYGLLTAPTSESAAAVGEPFSGPIASLAVESIAGGTVCCAVAMTVLYGFASYGLHPGRPSPEERLLDD